MKKTKSTQEQNESQQIIYFRLFNTDSIIQNQDINFGGKYHLKFNPENNSLEIYLNENFIDDFFNNHQNNESELQERNIKKRKISNITAIVGENGTGKTTFIEEFTKIFTDSIYNNSKSFILVTLINNHVLRTYCHNMSNINPINKTTNQSLNLEPIRYSKNSGKNKSFKINLDNFTLLSGEKSNKYLPSPYLIRA